MGMLDNLNMFFGKDAPEDTFALTATEQFSDPQPWMKFMGRGTNVYTGIFLDGVDPTTTVTINIYGTESLEGTPTWVQRGSFNFEPTENPEQPYYFELPEMFKEEYVRLGILASAAGGTAVVGVTSAKLQSYEDGLYINKGREEFYNA